MKIGRPCIEMIETYQNLLSLPHVCRWMYPDFVVWDQRSRRSACAPHSLINKNIKHFVRPDLGPNCQLILSAADKVSRTAWCLNSKPPLLLLARGGLNWRMKADFAHKTWLYPARKFCPRGGVSNFDNVFFSWWWERGSKHHYKRAIIGMPAKHHLNGVSLIDVPTP